MNDPAPAADRFTGLVLDLEDGSQFQLTERLAHNAETAIYRTDHPAVVVKMFDLSCGRVDEVGYGPYMDFQAELANFEDLRAVPDLAPWVPTYYGAHLDYERKHALIAMEFLAGENLKGWAETIAAGGFRTEALDEFRRMTYEMLALIALFHRHGFMLMDFKPENVMRLTDRSIRFVDLGALFTPRHRRALNSFVYSATPDHAEVLIDASNLLAGSPPTEATDVFSAGVALFEMATGQSRLSIEAQTAEEMLGMTDLFLFRDSQIRDIWKGFPHLRELLPQVQNQLRERRLLFSELWPLLKAYVGRKVPGWETLPDAHHDQILLATGTTFIQEQLPPRLAWLSGPIARTTTLRGLRLKDIGEIVLALGNPVSDYVRDDVAQHNCLLDSMRALDLQTAFAARLNTWEVRMDRHSERWAIAAPFACRQAGPSAGFIYLKHTHVDDEGQRYYHVVEDLEADEHAGGRLSLQDLARDHFAWVGSAPP